MIGTWLVFAGVALASNVLDTVRPVVSDPDVQSRFDAWRTSQGETGVERLACESVWSDHALLCYRVWEGKKRRWVTQDDLTAWELHLADLRRATAGAVAGFLAKELQSEKIADMRGTYWVARDGDGWAAAAILDPAAVASRVGLPMRVAVPTEGILLAWQGSDSQIDHVMAVGVREIYDTQQQSVSPMIHSWDGKEWSLFGSAKPVVSQPP